MPLGQYDGGGLRWSLGRLAFAAEAFAGFDDGPYLYEYDVASGATQLLTDLGLGVLPSEFLEYSPNGDWLAFVWDPLTGSGERTVASTLDGSRQTLSLTRADGSPLERAYFHWSPDGRYLVALEDFTSILYLVDMDRGGASTRLFGADVDEIFESPAWLPDSSLLVIRAFSPALGIRSLLGFRPGGPPQGELLGSDVEPGSAVLPLNDSSALVWVRHDPASGLVGVVRSSVEDPVNLQVLSSETDTSDFQRIAGLELFE